MANPITVGLLIGGAAVSLVSNIAATNAEISQTQDQNKKDMQELAEQKKASFEMANSNMVEQAKQNAYDSAVAVQSAQIATGKAQAQAGYSGVRGASPLLALKQQEEFASAQANEQLRRANEGLENEILKASLLTDDYQRKIARLQSDYDYMNKNAWKYYAASGLGSIGQSLSNAAEFVPLKTKGK